MLPGSLYYHFATKEDLLAAVYAEGVRRISEAVSAAIAGKRDPWERLEAACDRAPRGAAARRATTRRCVIRVRPADAPSVAGALVKLRDDYERLFVELVAGAAARARHRPAEPAADAARRAQLVADLVSARGRDDHAAAIAAPTSCEPRCARRATSE